MCQLEIQGNDDMLEFSFQQIMKAREAEINVNWNEQILEE